MKLKLKRARGSLFLALFLLAFISGLIVLPAAQASLGARSDYYVTAGTYLGYNMATAQGDIYQIGSYLYALGTATPYARQWKSSADGGEVWNTASTAYTFDSATVSSNYRAFHFDTVYDSSTGALYMVYGRTATGQTGRDVLYKELSASAGAVVPIHEFFLLTNTATDSMWGNVGAFSMCMLDHTPVVAISGLQNLTGSGGAQDYYISVWFTDSYSPESAAEFTHYQIHDPMGYVNDVFQVELHAVNSTTVLVVFNSQEEDTDDYGYFVGKDTGFEDAASFVVCSSHTIDRFIDVNQKRRPMSSTNSRNVEDPSKYADRIISAYVDAADRSVWLDVFNVTSRTIDSDEIVYNATGSPSDAYFAGVSKYGQNFYVHWMNYTSGSEMAAFIRERDENGIWSSTYVWEDDFYFATSGYPTLMFAGTLINNTRLYALAIGSTRPFTGEYAFYISASGVPEAAYWEGNPPYVTAPDLENIDSGLDWVFTDWKYYTFTLNIPNPILDVYDNLTDVAIRFNVSTGEEEIQCDFYANNTERLAASPVDDVWEWTFNSSMSSALETRFGQPVQLQEGTVSYDATNNETDISFQIWFTRQCLDVYIDPINITAEANWLNYSWTWFDANLGFYLYSKGGFAKNFYSSDAARANCLAGEEWAALYAYNGSNVENEIWFRDLQHVKMLPYVQGYTGLDPFSISFTMDYSVGEGEWLPGWECTITPMTIHWSGLFAQEVWINMTVNWYQGTGTPGAYTLVKSDYLYMFFHGSVTGSGQPFAWRFWFDAWFNSINASSTGGGRINAFEYPMKDNADLWFRWLANNWGVKDDVAKESTYMADLKDTDNLIMSSERIKMVRCKVALVVYEANSGQLIQLHDYEVLDYTHSKELPLHGIQTPVFDDTKMPDVGQTGLLGALFSVFAGIGQWLSENVMFGGLNLWGNFVAFLDTIAGWLGAPKFFTNLFNWIGSGFTYLIQSATYIFTLLYNFFLMIGQLMAAFITTLGEFVLSIITTLGYLVDFLGGIGTGAGNLWVQFNIWGWVQVALVFYPLYLIILWDQEGMDAVVSQLTMIWGIASWLFGFFIQIIMAVISFAHTLIESIPVAE